MRKLRKLVLSLLLFSKVKEKYGVYGRGFLCSFSNQVRASLQTFSGEAGTSASLDASSPLSGRPLPRKTLRLVNSLSEGPSKEDCLQQTQQTWYSAA